MPDNTDRTTDLTGPGAADIDRPASPRPSQPPEQWTGVAGVDYGSSGHPFPGNPQGLGSADATTEATTTPPAPSTALAPGSVVVSHDPAGPGDLPRGPRYGVILEAVDLDGATEPAYRVGWLQESGQLYPESALRTPGEDAGPDDDGR